MNLRLHNTNLPLQDTTLDPTISNSLRNNNITNHHTHTSSHRYMKSQEVLLVLRDRMQTKHHS